MKTSIIVPTLCRPAQLRRTVERLLQTVNGLDTEIIVVAEVNEQAIRAMAGLPVRTAFHADWRGSVANWNIGAAMATGDVLVTGADDLWWGDGWLAKALAYMETAGTCYCGLNDLQWDGRNHDPTHWIITRQGVIEHCGGCLMPPCYKTTYADNEVAARIRRAGQYAWCEGACAEHRHFSAGKSPVDKCYRTMIRFYHEDQIVYRRRQAAGWPDDFPPVVI